MARQISASRRSRLSRAVWFPAQQREMFCAWWMALSSSFRASIRSLMASLVVIEVSFLKVELEDFRFHSRPRSSGGGVKSESVLVSRAARNWRPPVRRSRRHRPPPFGLPCRTRPFLRGPLLPGQPRFPFPAVACFPAPKGLRLAELGTCGERPPGKACGTLGRGPCSRPIPVCVRL